MRVEKINIIKVFNNNAPLEDLLEELFINKINTLCIIDKENNLCFNQAVLKEACFKEVKFETN